MQHKDLTPPDLAGLRHLVRAAIARADLPALVVALLTALLALLDDFAARPAPAPTAETPSAAQARAATRAANRLRAWIGWILRCEPDLGMRPFGARPAPLAPVRAARAPPRPG